MCVISLTFLVFNNYSPTLINDMLQLPNILGFILGVLQMLLYGIYKNSNENNKVETKLTDEKKQVAEVHINIIDIVKKVPGAVDQVYPLDSQTSSCSSNNDVSSDDEEHKNADSSTPTQDIAPILANTDDEHKNADYSKSTQDIAPVSCEDK